VPLPSRRDGVFSRFETFFQRDEDEDEDEDVDLISRKAREREPLSTKEGELYETPKSPKEVNMSP